MRHLGMCVSLLMHFLTHAWHEMSLIVPQTSAGKDILRRQSTALLSLSLIDAALSAWATSVFESFPTHYRSLCARFKKCHLLSTSSFCFVCTSDIWFALFAAKNFPAGLSDQMVFAEAAMKWADLSRIQASPSTAWFSLRSDMLEVGPSWLNLHFCCRPEPASLKETFLDSTTFSSWRCFFMQSSAPLLDSSACPRTSRAWFSQSGT